MIRERWIITIYCLSFFTHFLNIEFMEECAFNEQCFLRFGMATLFVISVYHIFCSLVKEED